MIFNFALQNHHSTSLNSLGDLLQPIYQGLEACGHHVIGFGSDFHEAPVVNVMVEFFKDDPIVDDLLRFKREHGDRFILGLLCTEDPEDSLVMDFYPNRRPNLERLAPAVDFIWTLLPVESYYRRFCSSDRVKLLRYGFSANALEQDIIVDPRQRDIDAVLYGNPHPYRTRIVGALEEAGLSCLTTEREMIPDFLVADLIRRAKLVLDVRRSPGVRFLSPTRIVKGLHCGTAVVSERFDESALAPLYAYTVACPYADLAARCREIIDDRSYVERGLAALSRFQSETSMRDNVATALKLPVFDRLARM